MSTVKTNSLQAVSGALPPALKDSAGNVAGWAALAWVNFNGTGVVGIRAAGNVSSITDNGVGDYTVNFTNAMVDIGYSFLCSGRRAASVVDGVVMSDAYLTGSCTLKTSNGAGALEDFLFVNVAIFR